MQPKMRYPYVLNTKWVFFRIADIEDVINRGHVYLRRLIVFKCPWCALYLHLIYSPDSGVHLHSHPRSFVSVVLWGGYSENRLCGNHKERRKRGWLSFAYTSWRDFHAIRNLFLRPTVTLLLLGCDRKVSGAGWGFNVEGRYIDATQYLNRGQRP